MSVLYTSGQRVIVAIKGGFIGNIIYARSRCGRLFV